MSFQRTVNIYPASAVAGDRASENPVIYKPFNYKAGGDVVVGGFVWPDASKADEVVKAGSGAPLGFVERELSHFNYDLTSEGTLIVAEGGAVPVAVRGDFYVIGETAAAVGNAVFVSTTDGSKIKFGASGSSVSGYVETSYKALTAGSIGDLIVISNWA